MNEISELLKEKRSIDNQLHNLTIGKLKYIDPILWETDEYSGDTEDFLGADRHLTEKDILKLTVKWDMHHSRNDHITFYWEQYSRGGYEYGGSYYIKIEYLLNRWVRDEATAEALQAKNHKEELARLDKEVEDEKRRLAQLELDRETFKELQARLERGEL